MVDIPLPSGYIKLLAYEGQNRWLICNCFKTPPFNHYRLIYCYKPHLPFKMLSWFCLLVTPAQEQDSPFFLLHYYMTPLLKLMLDILQHHVPNTSQSLTSSGPNSHRDVTELVSSHLVCVTNRIRSAQSRSYTVMDPDVRV